MSKKNTAKTKTETATPKRGRGRPRVNFTRIQRAVRLDDGNFRACGRGRPRKDEERVDVTVPWDATFAPGTVFTVADDGKVAVVN